MKSDKLILKPKTMEEATACYPSALPTPTDLRDAFSKLPSAEGFPHSYIIIVVEATAYDEVGHGGFVSIHRQYSAPYSKLRFEKWKENEKWIWVYNGPVKRD